MVAVRRSPEHEAFDIAIGRKIRIARKIKGLTGLELGKKMDVTFQQVHKYENGEHGMTLFKLVQFGKALGIKWEDLVPVDSTSAADLSSKST